MKLTERRTMLYLPEALYQRSLSLARRRRQSLASLVREAMTQYLAEPRKSGYKTALKAGLGLWKLRTSTGVDYENRLRAQWKDRKGS